jgi:hypothetical protein
MGYMLSYKHLGQTAAEIQARLPALLDAYCWLKLQKRERSFPRRLADSFVQCIARYAGATVHHTISTEIVDAQAWMR